MAEFWGLSANIVDHASICNEFVSGKWFEIELQTIRNMRHICRICTETIVHSRTPVYFCHKRFYGAHVLNGWTKLQFRLNISLDCVDISFSQNQYTLILSSLSGKHTFFLFIENNLGNLNKTVLILHEGTKSYIKVNRKIKNHLNSCKTKGAQRFSFHVLEAHKNKETQIWFS